MIPRKISDTSIVASVLRNLYKSYAAVEQGFSRAYQSSHFHRLTSKFMQKLKVCFKYCFLARISETKDAPSAVLNNSRAVQYLINAFIRRKNNFISLFRPSLIGKWEGQMRQRLYLFPLRIISIIAISAVIVNIILSFILQRQIGGWGWLLRGLFLFAALIGLSSKADWPNIISSSIILGRNNKK